MYDTSEIRKNLKIQIDGVPYTVVDFQFVKPGKGQPFTRCKLRNMMTGSQLERTWKSGEKLERASLEEKQMQFLYLQDGFYTFMDTTNYDQLQISKEQMGENALYLMDGTMVDVLLFNELPIGVTPPTFVEMKVVQTDPGFKGDTSGNTTKPATLESGLVVNVPLFVNEGELLKIDTRTGEYVERVKVGR